MSFAFKKFSFSHQIELIDHGFPHRGASCHATTSPSSSLARLFVGCNNGSVHVLNENAQLLYAFPSHGYKVVQCAWLEPNFLLTVGSEEPGVSSTSVKIWDLQRLETLSSPPPPTQASRSSSAVSASDLSTPFVPLSTPPGSCLRTSKLFSPPSYPESQVTALDAIAQGLHATIAVGLASGMVYTLTTELPLPSPAAAAASTTAVASKAVAPAKVLMMIQHLAKINARPEGGSDHWCINSLHLHQPNSRSEPALAAKPVTGGGGGAGGGREGGKTPPGQSPPLQLFVVTESQTLSFNLDSGLKTILDQQGGLPYSSTLRSQQAPLFPSSTTLHLPSAASATSLASQAAQKNHHLSRLLVVARDEGLYDYTSDTRAGCTVFEGTKHSLTTLRNRYMVVTCKEGGTGAARTHKEGSSGLEPITKIFSSASSTQPSSTVHLVDCKNRIVAGSFTLAGVTRVISLPWSINDGVLVVCSNGSALLLKLVDLSVQLESFYKRSLYKLALDVAKAEGAAEEVVSGIQKLWGDYLYSRGEFEAAMSQYLDTLGHLEPSYVIRRYLDAQRTSNLTLYLESLHDKSLASVDHTTLLLNCYTKLKDVASLDAFISSGGWKKKPRAELGGGEESMGELGKSLAPTLPPSDGSASMIEKLYDSFATGNAAIARDSNTSLTCEQPTASDAQGGRLETDTGASPHALHSFASQDSIQVSSLTSSLRFDPETAFRVLFSAGYSSHALKVARMAKEPEWILEVLLNELEMPDHHPVSTPSPSSSSSPSPSPLSTTEATDGGISRRSDLQEAVRFLETLPRRQRSAALLKHGKVLIECHAEEATRLLMELCIPTQMMSLGGAGGGDSDFVASVSDFSLLYNTRPSALMLLCEFVLASTSANAFSSSGSRESQNLNLNLSEESQRRNERMLHHTLLDLYLADSLADEGGGKDKDKAEEARMSSKRSRRVKALELLHNGWPPHLMDDPKYSPDHALILCRLQEFSDGLVFLYDRLGLHREVLAVHMAQNDHERLIEAVVKYGDSSIGGDPQLWSELLDFFTAQLDSLPSEHAEGGGMSSVEGGAGREDKAKKSLLVAVEHIERGNILPPLLVLQALSKSGQTGSISSSNRKSSGLCMGDVRGYIERQLERETSELESCRSQIERLAAESAQMHAEAQKLKSQPRVFQATRCAASGQPLELPIVHFYCGHSFNQKSLGDNDGECPICAPDFKRVAEIKRGMALSAVQQDRFFSELKGGGADGGFSIVAEYLGRGLLNHTGSARI